MTACPSRDHAVRVGMRPVVTQHGFPVPSHDHTQHHTERILADRARELGARFLWSSAVVGVQQNAAGVEVIIDGPEVDSIRAGYLVGCDGGHSRVRELSGIAFPGDAPLSHWVVGDIALDSPPDENGAFGRNEVIGTYQISRAEPGWFRLSMMRTTPPADRTAPVTLDEIRDVLRTGLGTDYGLREARWASRFSDGFRQATTYRQGRVLLAGDAAHTHSPIGGQGLNLGIQDAVNLGWKLAATVAGTAPAGLLDTYHAERHPVVHAVLRMTKAQTALIKPGHQVDALRDLVGDFLADPGICLGISGTLSGLDLRYPLGDAHPLLGRRIPNLQLTTTAGPTDSHTLLHPGRSLLIDLGAGLPAEVFHPWAGTLDVITAKLRGRDENHWHIPVLGDIPAPGAVFVRPDGYIAWLNPAGEPLDPAGLTTVLAGWLGH